MIQLSSTFTQKKKKVEVLPAFGTRNLDRPLTLLKDQSQRLCKSCSRQPKRYGPQDPKI